MKLNFKSQDFVHLHLHTDYSLLQSTIQLKPLAKRLRELEMKACAMTDYGNMYGAISFYKSMKANEIHPIIGYEAFFTFGSRFDREIAAPRRRTTLLQHYFARQRYGGLSKPGISRLESVHRRVTSQTAHRRGTARRKEQRADRAVGGVRRRGLAFLERR